MKNIVLLGGSGYIGQHLMLEWTSRRKDVRFYSVSRRGVPEKVLPDLKDAGITWIAGDVCNPGSFESSLPEKVDAVIDLVGTAAGKTMADFERLNVEPVGTMIRLMKEKNISKGAYVSGLIGMPGKNNMFKTTKKKGEALAGESGLDICIVRPSLVYGDREGVGAMVAMMKFMGLFDKKMKPVTVDALARQIIDGVNLK